MKEEAGAELGLPWKCEFGGPRNISASEGSDEGRGVPSSHGGNGGSRCRVWPALGKQVREELVPFGPCCSARVD